MSTANSLALAAVTRCTPMPSAADPTLEWVRQLGTVLNERSNAVTTDDSGGVYISGLAVGDLDGDGPGPFGNTDAFLTKYDAGTGDLDVSLADSGGTFAPSPGDRFKILSIGSRLGNKITGSFDKELIPELPGGLYFELVAGGSTKATTWLSIDVLGQPGDYNRDNVVDAADYSVCRDTLGQTGYGLPADGDGNGKVNQFDFEVWRTNYGMTSSAIASYAQHGVPEPAASAPLLIVLVVFYITRRGGPAKCSAQFPISPPNGR